MNVLPQYAPYKKGSGLTEARQAKELGLEPAALEPLNTPHSVDLHSWDRPGTKGELTHTQAHTHTRPVHTAQTNTDKHQLTVVVQKDLGH